MALDFSADWGEIEESSTGEYITADDGYDADVEVPIGNHQNLSSKYVNQLGSLLTEVPRGSTNANPALCSLTIDLLIHFSKQ